MKKDLTIVGLLFTLLITFGVQVKNNYHFKKLEKELNDTKDVVYYISDKLDIAYEMVESLNEEQSLMKQEIEQMKRIQRITKELR